MKIIRLTITRPRGRPSAHWAEVLTICTPRLSDVGDITCVLSDGPWTRGGVWFYSEICSVFWNLKSEICSCGDFSFFESNHLKSEIWNLPATIQRSNQKVKSEIWNLKSEGSSKISWVQALKSEIWNLPLKICHAQNALKSEIWNLPKVGGQETQFWNLKSEICLDSLRCQLDAVRFLLNEKDSMQ